MNIFLSLKIIDRVVKFMHQNVSMIDIYIITLYLVKKEQVFRTLNYMNDIL